MPCALCLTCCASLKCNIPDTEHRRLGGVQWTTMRRSRVETTSVTEFGERYYLTVLRRRAML